MEPQIVENERDQAKAFKVRVTHNADVEPIEVELQEQVSKVLQDAVNAFKLAVQPHTMGLFTESGVQVAGRKQDGSDIQQTVKDAGIEPDQLLVLRQVVVSGG